MNSLRSLQDQCYRAFLLGDAEALLPELVSREIPAPISVQVYQNNARETYRKALLASYPVIERLVGEDCFRGLAQKYMRDYPSTSGDLQNFVVAFPKFLFELYGDSDFAYLPDVARLEWAAEEVQLAGESERIDLDALSRLDPGRYANVRFSRSKSARLVCSPYPILSIWKTNQLQSTRSGSRCRPGLRLGTSRRKTPQRQRRAESDQPDRHFSRGAPGRCGDARGSCTGARV